MDRIFIFVVCFAFVYGGAFAPAVAQKRSIPVLIVDGFSNHDWKQTTVVTKWILEEQRSLYRERLDHSVG